MFLVMVLAIFINNRFLKAETDKVDYTGERVSYLISPLGRSEYNNLGLVDLNGKKVNLVIFKTKVLLFEDTEKIYSDRVSLLPLRIERSISRFWSKEYITEDYDQKKFTVVMRKFKGKKLVQEQFTQANGSIHNAITLPFYLRELPNLKIGWYFMARVPGEFRVELVSIDKISVPAGRFQAYHFKSTPNKFEIWINRDDPRVLLKIQGQGIFDYALLMKKYDLSSIPK